MLFVFIRVLALDVTDTEEVQADWHIIHKCIHINTKGGTPSFIVRGLTTHQGTTDSLQAYISNKRHRVEPSQNSQMREVNFITSDALLSLRCEKYQSYNCDHPQNCPNEPKCGYCSRLHKIKDCIDKKLSPKCTTNYTLSSRRMFPTTEIKIFDRISNWINGEINKYKRIECRPLWNRRCRVNHRTYVIPSITALRFLCGDSLWTAYSTSFTNASQLLCQECRLDTVRLAGWDAGHLPWCLSISSPVADFEYHPNQGYNLCISTHSGSMVKLPATTSFRTFPS